MKIIDCVQGSPEWFSARCGIATASNFDKIITTKGDPSKQARKYLLQTAGERVTGKSEETYKSAAMTRGTEMEAEARSFYELTTGNKVDLVGFCLTEGKVIVGASPDGFVGIDDGMVEFKCPLLATQVSYLVDGGLVENYFQQVQGELFITGRRWCDIVSYFPAIKPIVIRCFPDLEFQKKLSVELEKFCIQLDEMVNQIK